MRFYTNNMEKGRIEGMKNDSKYWESLRGTELINRNGEIAFVANIDPKVGFTIKGLDDGEIWWCDDPQTPCNDYGTYEEHFDFALNCILAGIMPMSNEYEDIFPIRNNLAQMLYGTVGKCPF